MEFTKNLMRCVQIEATKHHEGIVSHHDGKEPYVDVHFNVMFDGLNPSIPFVVTTTYNILI
jgi:hypothetical protein